MTGKGQVVITRRFDPQRDMFAKALTFETPMTRWVVARQDASGCVQEVVFESVEAVQRWATENGFDFDNVLTNGSEKMTTIGSSAAAYWYGAYYIPGRMMPGIRRYIEQGIIPGDFLYAVITNDLMRAVQTADEENLANLPAYVAYFYSEVPSDSYGSREKVSTWSKAMQFEHKAQERQR